MVWRAPPTTTDAEGWFFWPSFLFTPEEGLTHTRRAGPLKNAESCPLGTCSRP